MPSISASNFPADKVNIHKRLLSIIGRNTKAIDTITKIPSPDLSKFTLPCTVLYASESAEPTIGINEFKVNKKLDNILIKDVLNLKSALDNKEHKEYNNSLYIYKYSDSSDYKKVFNNIEKM